VFDTKTSINECVINDLFPFNVQMFVKGIYMTIANTQHNVIKQKIKHEASQSRNNRY